MTWMYSVAYWILLFTLILNDIVVRFADMCDYGEQCWGETREELGFLYKEDIGGSRLYPDAE